MFKYTKRGNLSVEAAIILPLIIIGILTISYLIKVNSTNENVISICADEARLLNLQSYTNLGKANAVLFNKKLQGRLAEENPKCDSFTINNLRYLYSYKGIDNLVSFKVKYRINHNFPIKFYDEMNCSDTILTRAFVGSDNYSQSKGFSIMEEEEESEIVWIFPTFGSKYHSQGCTYVRNSATKTILNSNIKKRYKYCKLCNSNDLNLGDSVYCFFSSGKSYHTGKCSTVDKYVVQTDKNEAERKGYTPCQKCGGN